MNWISVKDDLPEENKPVVVFKMSWNDCPFIGIARMKNYGRAHYFFGHPATSKPTHWHEIPKQIEAFSLDVIKHSDKYLRDRILEIDSWGDFCASMREELSLSISDHAKRIGMQEDDILQFESGIEAANPEKTMMKTLLLFLTLLVERGAA